MLLPKVAARVARSAAQSVSAPNVRNMGPNVRANLPKNVVTKGFNEPSIRVSDRVLDGKKRQLQRGTLPVTNSEPVSSKKRVLNRGTLPGGSAMNGSGARQPQAVAGGGGGNPPNPPRPYKLNRGTLPGGSMNGSTTTRSRWRGVEDIKNTATGQAPMSTFFRTREARDAMMASGQGKDYQWAKGTTSWGRVAGTAAAGYAGMDTIDRMGSGGSITRNETGRFDMMGIPIL